jgi:hypothetical protein
MHISFFSLLQTIGGGVAFSIGSEDVTYELYYQHNRTHTSGLVRTLV